MVEPQGLKATLTLKSTYESVSVCSCSLALSTCACARVPQSDTVVPTARGEGGAAGTEGDAAEGDAVDTTCASLQCGLESARARVPHAADSAASTRQHSIFLSLETPKPIHCSYDRG
jgi:hypothetical protein